MNFRQGSGWATFRHVVSGLDSDSCLYVTLDSAYTYPGCYLPEALTEQDSSSFLLGYAPAGRVMTFTTQPLPLPPGDGELPELVRTPSMTVTGFVVLVVVMLLLVGARVRRFTEKPPGGAGG